MNSIRKKIAAFVLLAVLSLTAFALDTVIVGDTQYTCSHTCVITHAYGQIWVSNSVAGGWVFAEPAPPTPPAPPVQQ